MARGPLIAFVAVLLAGALAAGGFLLKQREVIASTPSAYTGLTIPLPVPGGSEACADEIAFDPDSEIARIGAWMPEATAPGPALEVTARGYDEGEYRNDYRSTYRIPGGWTGTKTFDVPLTPPKGDAFGYLCVRNLGTELVNLVGSHEGRAYSRPTVRIDGVVTAANLQLRLLQRGRHSLLSRVGETTAHASTLKPFGAWWWWVLALALLAVTPLATFAALRTALATDEVRDVQRTVPDVAPALRRAERIPGWAIVAAVCVLAALWFIYWGLSTHVFQNDEDQYVYLSRWLQTDLPSSLWNFDIYGRGLQRLEVWLLAIPSALSDSPWSLRGGRILNTLAWVSTAIPVYLLGRRLDLRPQWAALPAVVSILVPWSVVTTAFLTENVAYPACLWAVWAIWRTAVTPSVRADLLALVLLVVAGLARSGLLLLVPALPLIAIGTSLRWASGGVLVRIRAMLREHVLLWAAAAFGVLVLILAALGVPPFDAVRERLAGGYLTQLGFDLSLMATKTTGYLAKLVLGTAFLPVAIGVPWVAIQLVRPRDRGSFAFALTVVVVAVLLLYSLNTAGPDERYVLYLAPLVLLPATLALARREVSAIGMGVTSILVVVILLRTQWIADQGPFGYFIAPTETFYRRAIGIRLDRILPGGEGEARAAAALALGVFGVALAVLLARMRGRFTPGRVTALAAVVVLAVLVQTQYTLAKYVNGAGAKSGPSDSTRAFADTIVPKGKTIGAFVEGTGRDPLFFSAWQEVQFYNQRIDTVYSLGPNVAPVPTGDELSDSSSFDPRTGALTTSLPLPDYIVAPMLIGEARVRGELVFASEYVPVGLFRVAKPQRLEWSAKGFDYTGHVAPGAQADVRFYGSGLEPGAYCATYQFIAPADQPAVYRFQRDGRDVASGRIEPGKIEFVKVPLADLPERDNVDIQLSGEGLRVSYIASERC